MDPLISFVVTLAIVVIVAVLIWWLLSQLPLPEPAGQIIRIVVVVAVAVVAIFLLLNLVGHGSSVRLR